MLVEVVVDGDVAGEVAEVVVVVEAEAEVATECEYNNKIEIFGVFMFLRCRRKSHKDLFDHLCLLATPKLKPSSTIPCL